MTAVWSMYEFYACCTNALGYLLVPTATMRARDVAAARRQVERRREYRHQIGLRAGQRQIG